jgi:hypothetical protein
MTTAPTPELLVRLPLQADESVVSFVQRHCEANYVARILDMLRLTSDVAGEPVDDIRDIVRSRNALRAVETLTGLTVGALESHFVAPVQSTHLRVGHHYWAEGQRRAEAQAVCPACLAESGYARTSWEFVQAPVCLVHGVALLENCPACAKPLRHNRTRLLLCGNCRCELGNAPRHAVSDMALAAAVLVQRPAMVAMGDPPSTAPIDQVDLGCLLRLCLPCGAGRGSMHGLTESLHRLSTDERIAALERLGSAWVDRRIDSARLRAVVLQRWASAGLLPPTAQIDLVKLAAVTAELPGDVLRLLCHGSDRQKDLPAATRFGGRPPQLLTLDAVAAYLGIDQDALAILRGSDGLATAPEGFGHDMDQVLALQRAMESLLTVAQVDAAMGVEGLTLELLRLNLLTALKLNDGKVVGVDLESLGMLLSLIQQKVENQSPVHVNGVPLARALNDGAELSRVAWMVAQLMGGSLRAYQWPAPHRLVDLVVDAERMRELSHWPSDDPLRCRPVRACFSGTGK